MRLKRFNENFEEEWDIEEDEGYDDYFDKN